MYMDLPVREAGYAEEKSNKGGERLLKVKF